MKRFGAERTLQWSGCCTLAEAISEFSLWPYVLCVSVSKTSARDLKSRIQHKDAEDTETQRNLKATDYTD